VYFETTASSPEPITYLWKFNGQPIAGATNRSLLLPNGGASGGGVYSVEVRTACAAVTNSATVMVLAAPAASPAYYTNSSASSFRIPARRFLRLGDHAPMCARGGQESHRACFRILHRYLRCEHGIGQSDGRQVKLMAGAGGRESVVQAWTHVSDAATSPLPETDQLVSAPTCRRIISGHVPASPAAGPYSTNLSTFNGANPNGPWKLFVFDSVPLDGGAISSWRLDLEWQIQRSICNIRVCCPTRVPGRGNGAHRRGHRHRTIVESPDLAPVATNVYSTRPGIFHDATPHVPSRFYRAMQP